MARVVFERLVVRVGPSPWIGESLRISPDHRRVAYVALGGNQSLVVVDGKEGKPYDEIGAGGPVFSPDSLRVAYIAREGNEAFVVIDGQEQKRYDGIGLGTLMFSPDSRRVAYVALIGSEPLVVVDGMEEKQYHEIRVDVSVFSPDSQRVAYTARVGSKWFAVVDGEEQTRYDDIERGNPILSPDSRQVAYVAQSGYKQFVVIDGQEGPPYDAVPGTSLLFSPNSQRVAYAARVGNWWSVVVDGQEQGQYEYVAQGTPIFSPDSLRVACMVRAGGKPVVVVDGVPQRAYSMIRVDGSTFFSPDSQRVAYMAQEHGKSFVVVDGKKQKAYDGVFLKNSLCFSPDSRRVIYAVKVGNKQFVVIDDREGNKYDLILHGMPVFSPDSKRVAYAAQVSRRFSKKWSVVVDESEGRYYDAILAIAGRSIQFDSPDSLRYLALRGSDCYSVQETIRQAEDVALSSPVAGVRDRALALVDQGNVYRSQGQLPEALEAYRQAFDLDPTRAAAVYGLGLVYGKLGEYHLAVPLFQQAIDLEPEYVDAHISLGNIYLSQHRLIEAAEMFQAAISIDPDLASVHTSLGIIYGVESQLGQAVQHFRQATDADPKCAEAHLHLALAYVQQDRFDCAKAALKEFLNHYPPVLRIFSRARHVAKMNLTAADELVNMGMDTLSPGDPASAQWSAIIPWILARWGMGRRTAGDPASALSYFKAASRLYMYAPCKGSLFEMLRYVWLKVWHALRDTLSRTSTESAARLRPELGIAYLDEAKAFHELLKPEAALEAFNRAREVYEKLGPAYHADVAATLHGMAQECRILDRLDEALAYLEQAGIRYGQAGNLLEQGRMAYNRAGLLHCLGNLSASGKAYGEAQVLFEQTKGGRKDLAYTLSQKAALADLEGEYGQALELELESNQLFLELAAQGPPLPQYTFFGKKAYVTKDLVPPQSRVAESLTVLAYRYVQLGQYEQAFEVLDRAEKRSQDVDTDGTYAIAYMAQGRFVEAEQLYRQIIRRNEHLPWPPIREHRGLAKALTEQGRHLEAYPWLERVTLRIEEIRGRIVLEPSRIGYFGSEAAVYAEIVLLCLNLTADEAKVLRLRPASTAWEYVERAKSRVFIEQLGQGVLLLPRRVDPLLLDREKALRMRVAVLRNQVQSSSESILDQSVLEGLFLAERELGDLWTREIEPLAPEYVAARRGKPTAWGEIRTMLGSGD